MKPVSEKTRKEDERLRQELENVDLEKLKQAIKQLIKPTRTAPKAGSSSSD
jgi:hypothetical protein